MVTNHNEIKHDLSRSYFSPKPHSAAVLGERDASELSPGCEYGRAHLAIHLPGSCTNTTVLFSPAPTHCHHLQWDNSL